MYRKIRILLVLSCLAVFVQANAQFDDPKTLEVGPHVGLSYYMGDLNPMLPFAQAQLQYGGIVRFNYNNRWTFRFDYSRATVTASDEIIKWRPERGLNFTSIINDFSLMAEFNFLEYYTGNPKKNVSPYIFGGFSVFQYTAFADVNGTMVDLSDQKTEYYDPNDLNHNAGILGWKANRHCIGRPDNELRRNRSYCSDYAMPSIFDSFKQMADGEYIPYPTQGGYLEVKVYAGVNCYDYGEGTIMGAPVINTQETLQWNDKDLYNKIRWLLYKAPKIELVKNNLVFDTAELDDIEYSGYINQAAKEEISIDTICGTSNNVCPTAKGIYCRASDNLQIQKLKRAGVTDHPEKLLIGTLYSQFAERKTTLSGEAVIDTGDICAYTEQNQNGKVFLMSGEIQDVIADTSDVQLTEFKADEYDAIEA